MSEDKKNVSLLLVGRDGNGKSSTGNSIFNLGDKKHFNPTSSSSSAGLEIKKASATVGNGREVTVTEIAGLEYPGSDYKGNFKETLKKIEDTIQENTEGFNAIIFVLKYGTRFTKQEKDSLQMIKSIFGVNVLKDFGVIVMTCGDSFELDVEEEEDKQTFEEWCHAQTGDVKTLFEKCAYRCVLFNNRTKDADKMKEQQDKLFSLVELIPHPYTLQKYKDKEAIRGRTEILVQIKLPQLEEHTNQMMDEVWKALNKIDQEFSLPTCNILELSNSLKNIQTKLLDLKKYLQDKDKKTGVLKPLFCAISIAEMRIDTKLKIAEQRLQVATLSGTWVIVSVNGSDFCSQDITETVSIRKCTLDGAGQFSSSSVSEKDVPGRGIVLIQICKTTPESQQVTKTSNELSCENVIKVDNISQTEAQDSDKHLEKFTQDPGCGTQAEIACAQGHEVVAQVQGHGSQLQDNTQSSPVLDHTGHDKADDFENTKIMFETIDTFLKEDNCNNAFCLISKYNNKLTNQEIEAVIKTFGSKVSNQGILILTCANDHLQVETDQMLLNWRQEETGTNQQLLDLCGNRCVLLNPWIKDEGALTAQKKRLVSLIQSVAGANTGNASENTEVALATGSVTSKVIPTFRFLWSYFSNSD